MNKKKIIIAAAVCLVCLALMVTALTAGRRTTVVFTPPAFDDTALSGVPTSPPADYSALDAQVFTCSICGCPALADGRAYVYLTNPADSAVNLKLRITDTAGNLLGESGLVRPGEYIPAVTLTATPAENGEVIMKLMAYDPQTYRSAGAAALQTTLNAI